MNLIQDLIARIKRVDKKYLIFLAVLLLIGVVLFITLRLFFPDSQLFTSSIQYLIRLYTNFLASGITKILQLFGKDIHVAGNEIILHNENSFKVIFADLKFRWLILLITIIWITPTTLKKRLLTSGFVVAFFILTNFLNYIFLSLISDNVELIDKYRELVFTIIAFSYIFILIVWIYKHQSELNARFTKLGIDLKFLQRTYRAFIIILFVTVIINNLLLYFIFSFDNYKYFILISAKGILNIFGYEASLQYPLLVGIKGDVHFVKPCLGIKILVTFAAFIMLTGTNYKKQIVFSIVGLIILNLANILRIVAIFMHLQTDLDEQASVEFHDYLKYVTYSLVFILWIIWLERYSDIWPYIRKKQQ